MLFTVRKSIWSVCLVCLVGLWAGSAQATLTTYHYTDDAVFQNYSTDFVAEGRAGGVSSYELDIHDKSGFGSGPEAEYDWGTPGSSHSFTVEYTVDNGNAELTYTLGGTELTQNWDYTPAYNQLFLRGRASKSGSFVELSDLTLDGTAVGDSMSTSPDKEGLDILQIAGLDLSGGFTLTGDAYLDVGSGSQSNPGFQVKLGSGSGPAPVPEPSTMILLGSGLLGLLGVGRKRFCKG